MYDYLNELKSEKSNELKFSSIKKFMIKQLGVEQLPNKGGSFLVFRHELLKKYGYNEIGNFTVHLKHGTIGKKEIIFKKNYLNHLHNVLWLIIELMQKGNESE